MKLATTRHVFWLPALPPEVDFMERGAFVAYVTRQDEPLEVIHYQVPEMIPMHPQGVGLAMIEDLCAGHLASHEKEDKCAGHTRL